VLASVEWTSRVVGRLDWSTGQVSGWPCITSCSLAAQGSVLKSSPETVGSFAEVAFGFG
jgi:hypothetical protein